VYSIQNLNTPIIFEIKAPPHFIHLCRKHFLTMDQINGIQVTSYEGRVVCSPKFQGMRPEYITKELVALAPDTLAVVDALNPKSMHVFDSNSGKEIGKIVHSMDIAGVGLNQHNLGPHERLLVFVDKNMEFFIASLISANVASAKGPVNFPFHKLTSHIESFLFNDETDMLVGVSDGKLHVWCHPASMFVDKDLLPLSSYVNDSAEFGRNAKISAYSGSKVTVRRVDGSISFVSTLSDVPLLYEFSRADRWDQCLRLCRLQNSSVLWGALASMSLMKKHLETSIAALAELNEVVKVEYLQFVQAIPSEEGRNAEMALFRRQPDEAERILLQASPPLVYRAIKMNIRLYRWSRALDMAVKNRSHVDTVLAYRKTYLEDFAKQETDAKFTQYSSQVTVDWEAIRAKEGKEVEEERSRSKNSRK
jgi:intraflagellar transport protein 80